jgi:hypothetical protein
MAWTVIPKSEALGVGTYRLTFTNYFGFVPSIEVPKSISVMGNVFSLDYVYYSQGTGTLTCLVSWKSYDTVQQVLPGRDGAPATSQTVRVGVNANTANATAVAIPAAAITLGIAAVLGVVVYFNLDKVEKLVDSPSVSIFLVALAAVAGVLVLRELRK